LQVVSATTNCPPASSGYTWIKINWTANAGGQAPNVVYTPTVLIAFPSLDPSPNASPGCAVLNVAAQPRTIRMQLFDGNGTSQADTTITVPPGNAPGFVHSVTFSSNFYCKFTVTDGTSADIRGTILSCQNRPVSQVCAPVAIAAQ